MKNTKLLFTKEVINQIKVTIGANVPETGGWLGSSDGQHIDHYYFDDTATTSHATYTPDTDRVSEVINAWSEHGVKLVGCIHSHPYGMTTPSKADFDYALKIIEAYNLDRFLMTIAQVAYPLNPSATRLYSYIYYKKNRKCTIDEVDYEDTSIKSLQNHYGHIKPEDLYQEVQRNRFQYHDCIFSKNDKLVPKDKIKDKVIVVIGTGGSSGFVEDMARYGFENFVLFDGDHYTPVNMATQKVYLSDIGDSKVGALKRRLLNINPEVSVKTINRFVNEYMSDSDFICELDLDIVFGKPTNILICACTDSFEAQKRASAIALKYGFAYMAPQIHAGGEAVEIFFSYPGVTPCCQQCALKSRYDAYKDGYKNTVTSDDTPISTVTQANALEGHIALMLLLYHEGNTRYSRMLDSVADRNLVLMSTSPFASEHLDLPVFKDRTIPDVSFFGETLWIPQHPVEGCPSCGGCGNLETIKDKVGDTRKV